MRFRYLIVVLFCLALARAASRREMLSNGAVYLSYTAGSNSSTGSGFIFFRPDDPTKAAEPLVQGHLFLVTNKHVLPPEGAECKLTMRVTTGSGQALSTKTLEVPIVGSDGKYLKTVRVHPKNDVAAVAVTDVVGSGGMRLDAGFLFTTLLGTKEKLKASEVGLVGDEIYTLGYPAGIFDTRNANPIWRIGIISTSPLLGYAFPEVLQRNWGLPSYLNGFIIDAQVYPGSSGSLVICKPQVTNIDSPGGVFAGGPRSEMYVLGIISGSIPMLDSNLHMITRIGLGIVESADAISETIESFSVK